MKEDLKQFVVFEFLLLSIVKSNFREITMRAFWEVSN